MPHQCMQSTMGEAKSPQEDSAQARPRSPRRSRSERSERSEKSEKSERSELLASSGYGDDVDQTSQPKGSTGRNYDNPPEGENSAITIAYNLQLQRWQGMDNKAKNVKLGKTVWNFVSLMILVSHACPETRIFGIATDPAQPGTQASEATSQSGVGCEHRKVSELVGSKRSRYSAAWFWTFDSEQRQTQCSKMPQTVVLSSPACQRWYTAWFLTCFFTANCAAGRPMLEPQRLKLVPNICGKSMLDMF